MNMNPVSTVCAYGVVMATGIHLERSPLSGVQQCGLDARELGYSGSG